MLLTSQNRNSVFQASFANGREVVLAAAVAHRKVASKRPAYMGMRRTRRLLGMAMRPDSIESDHRPTRGDRQPPAGCTGHKLPSRLWASLVLSKMSRG